MQDNRDDLKDRDQVDSSIGRSVLLCGARNQSVSTPSSETRLSTPFEPMIAVFTAPDNIRNPTITTNAWNSSLSHSGPTKFIARPEIRLVEILRAHVVGDYRDSEERDERCEQQ